MSEDETVIVPKALLAQVLDNAESDNYSTQSEFSCTSADDAYYAAQRKLIADLRKAAGIGDTKEAIGQGFFGAALAIKEQSDKS